MKTTSRGWAGFLAARSASLSVSKACSYWRPRCKERTAGQRQRVGSAVLDLFDTFLSQDAEKLAASAAAREALVSSAPLLARYRMRCRYTGEPRSCDETGRLRRVPS